ncbi:hypothetical protein, variant [Aphanomyces astaci]|uniref:Uncharacterized protein n=1 Tax=Aphanomyces astaci TaxID=112090 RepID=W4H067_APHAT|nr:hypothetical protein, variant [Aphanomyces astaci]ETV84966.1 hypothetical protein, variant [Aphanomyces astaci]|eukprot:XP_009824984.1 hypothetical protein, variant [Aphanomyces astaci]
MAAAELDRHVRVQRALDQVNGISISRIYNDALAQNKAKKSASEPSFEERIEAIMMKTQEIAQRLQLSQRQCLDSFDSLGVEDDCIDDDDDESVDGFTIMDDNAHASHSFKRQLSRFLLLPRSLSQREMEEITDMVLLEVNNTPDHSILMHEIGSLIDEHVLTPRDDVSSPSCDDDGQRHHRDSLSKRRQVSITTTKCPSPPSTVHSMCIRKTCPSSTFSRCVPSIWRNGICSNPPTSSTPCRFAAGLTNPMPKA